jgi:O-antigen ligase
MSAAVARIGDAFHLGPRVTWLVCLAGLIGLVSAAALATRFGILILVLAAIGAVVLTVVSFRFPLMTLLLFAAFIPIEEVVLIDGIGTISRFAGILFAVTYGIPRLGRLSFGAMPRTGWAYLAWATLSLGWAISPTTSWAELPTLLQLFLIAVLVADYVVQRPEIVRPVLWTYSLSAGVTALIGIETYLTRGLADSRTAALTGQDPAQFAALLLPALFFSLSEVLNGHRRIPAGVVALLTTIGVIVSGTRGAWFALGVVVLLFVLPRLTARRRLVAVATIVLLLGSAYQVPGVADLIAERSGNALSTGGAGRTDIWSVATTIYRSAPVVGVGFANFPVAYTPDVVAASGITSNYRLSGYGPHNVVVGTLIELGPLGLALLLLFLGPLILQRGWGANAAAVQAALASLAGVALFLDILANRKQVWLIIGIAAGLAYLARHDRAEARSRAAPPGSEAPDDPPGAGVGHGPIA